MITETELEDRLRAACDAVIPRLLGEPAGDGSVRQLERHRPHHRRFRSTSIAAAVALIVGAAGIFVALRHRQPEPVASSGGAELRCDDSGCHGWNELPVVPGASDFYIGPESLGEPIIHRNLFESLTRCKQLDATFTNCAKLEGIAGVSLVDYPVDPSITVDTVDRSELSYSIHVTTTFTDVGAVNYAHQWYRLVEGQPIMSDVTIRGHRGVTYEDHYGLPAVTWEERQGVVVTVSVPPEMKGNLLAVAAGIRSQAGPTTIPDRVAIGDAQWQSVANGTDGLVVGRLGDSECVGYRRLEQCDQSIAGRTSVRNDFTDGVNNSAIAGATPADVDRVRVTLDDGSTADIATKVFANYRSRFYESAYAGRQIVKVEWIDGSGAAVATTGYVPTNNRGDDPTAPTVDTDLVRGLVLVDASGDPALAAAFVDYLQANGVAVMATVSATRQLEQTQLNPIVADSGDAEQLRSVVGIDGFDTFTPDLIGGPLPAGTNVVITLGTDGGPPLFRN